MATITEVTPQVVSGIGTAMTAVAAQRSPVTQSMEISGKSEKAMAPDVVPSDSDSDAEDDTGPRPQHVTERRRVQNSIFSNW